MRTARRRLALLGVLLLGGPAAAGDEERAVRLREVDNPFRSGWDAWRVRDRTTERPIPGAWMRSEGEDDHPLGTLLDGPPVATADEDGWISGPEESMRGGWFYVGGPGHGPQGWDVGAPDEIRLRRGVDLPVRVVDARCRPVEGARVSWYPGCGHTSDLLRATSGPDGIALVRGVDPTEGWFWPVADGVEGQEHSDLDGGVPWADGDPPFTLHGGPAPVVEGRVLDAEGRPVRGAFVGGTTWHRGPWTATDAHGRFRLVGLPSGRDLRIDPNADSFDVSSRASSPLPGLHRLVRLDAAGKVLEEPKSTVVVEVRDEETGAPPSDRVLVLAVRRADGAVASATTDVRGEARIDLPSGRHVLSIGGALGPWFETVTEASVPTATTVRLDALRTPALRVALADVPAGSRVFLRSDAASREVTEEARAGAVLAPEGQDLSLVVVTERGLPRARATPVPWTGRGAAARPLVVRGLRPTVVRARLVDAAGRPVPARAGFLHGDGRPEHPEPARAEVALETLRYGPDLLVVRPEDAALAPLRVRLSLPDADGAVVDLGDLTVPTRAARTLTVLDANGKPADAAVSDAETEAPGDVDDAGRVTFGEGDDAWLPYPGQVVVLRGPAPRATWIRRLEGEGPWTIRWPAGVVEIVARETDGSAVAGFVVHLDGEEFLGEQGRSEVRGVGAGPHRVLVSRPDRPRAIEARFDLGDGETRRVEVALPPPPEEGATMGGR